MTSALSTVQRTADVEHKLEDLARRLAGELGIDLKPDKRYHGISAPTWLSGENRKFSMDYSDGMIYSDGKGGVEYDEEEEEYVNITKSGREYPKTTIIYSGDFCFMVNVADYILPSFLDKHSTMNPVLSSNKFYHRLLDSFTKEEKDITPVRQRDKGTAFSTRLFIFSLSLDEINFINGNLIKHLLS